MHTVCGVAHAQAHSPHTATLHAVPATKCAMHLSFPLGMRTRPMQRHGTNPWQVCSAGGPCVMHTVRGMPAHTACLAPAAVCGCRPPCSAGPLVLLAQRGRQCHANSTHALQVAMGMGAATPGASPAQRAPPAHGVLGWLPTPHQHSLCLWYSCVLLCTPCACNATTPHPCACCAQGGAPRAAAKA